MRSVASAEYMEQLKSIGYSFSGWVREEGDSLQKLDIAISDPEPSGKGDSVCQLLCPFFRATPYSIYGVEHDQALELSRQFVETRLRYRNAGVTDDGGNEIFLPPVRKTSD